MKQRIMWTSSFREPNFISMSQDFVVVQFGSDTKALKVQSCKFCYTCCYSSQDEGRDVADAFKFAEVKVDSQAHGNMLIYFPMQVIQKRGCMLTDQYSSIIAELKKLKNTGDFEGHEKLVETQMVRLKS